MVMGEEEKKIVSSILQLHDLEIAKIANDILRTMVPICNQLSTNGIDIKKHEKEIVGMIFDNIRRRYDFIIGDIRLRNIESTCTRKDSTALNRR